MLSMNSGVCHYFDDQLAAEFPYGSLVDGPTTRVRGLCPVAQVSASSRMHFISGLPRAGSSMFAAIMRQNPAFHAAMSGPLCGIVAALLRSMGAANEYSQFLSDN